MAVHLDPCVPVDRAQLDRLLAIELGTSAAEKPVAGVPTEVWVSCGPSGVQLRVEDGVTRKSMTRVLPAASFRDASSTRLLALAIAEFVVASWIELRVQAAPSVEPVGPPPSPEMQRLAERAVAQRGPEPSPEPPRSDSVSAAFTLQTWSGNDALVLGAGVRLLHLALPALAWTIAGDFGTASTDATYGTVSMIAASAAVGLGAHLRIHSLSLYSGVGARLGFTRIEGQPNNRSGATGDHFFAPYGGPMWWNRFELRATDELRLAIEIEIGVATLPARALAGGDGVFALDGAWLTSALSLGIGF